MTQSPTSTAGALVLLAREDAGLSQRELAKRVGVTQADIARIESGVRQPSIPTLQRILAGAGKELRFRLAPLDEHDRVLEARRQRRSDAGQAEAASRRRRDAGAFAANARNR